VPLALCAAAILLFWEENYGESTTPALTKVTKAAAAPPPHPPSGGAGSRDEEGPSSPGDDDDDDDDYDDYGEGDRSAAVFRRAAARDAGRSKEGPPTSFVVVDDDDDDDDDPVVDVKGGVDLGVECATPLLTGTGVIIDGGGSSFSPSKCKRERNNTNGGGMFSALLDGVRTVCNSPEILVCCIVGSVFEGAMYIFIFLWTPTLTSLQEKLDHLRGDGGDPIDEANVAAGEDVGGGGGAHGGGEIDLPFGWIFSTFMVSCMLGTIAFSRLSDAGVSASRCLAGILALASVSCLAMASPLSSIVRGGHTSSAGTLQYAGMLLYEFCIGF
jgi:hypothetical protein